MYKNLDMVLKGLDIKKVRLSEDVLNYEYQKYLTTRLKGSTRFTDEEMDRIYSFLRGKGYKGEKNYLFEYSAPVPNKKEKPSTRLSWILNRRMKELGLTNSELAELINVSENTVSLWRNGKIQNIDSGSIAPLCEVLNINPLSLLSDNYVEVDEYISDEYHQSKIKHKKLVDSVYKLILDYQCDRGYEDGDLRVTSTLEGVIKSEIVKTINRVDIWIDGGSNLHDKRELVERRNAEVVANHYYDKNDEIQKEIDSLLEDIKNHKDEDPRKKLKKINLLTTKMVNNVELASKLYRNEFGLAGVGDDIDDDFDWND